MDRKQAGILVSLLVLIVIVGVASWKLNGDLPELNSPVGSLGVQDREEATDELIDLQLKRDGQATANMSVFKRIIDDEKSTDEQRSIAQEQVFRMTKQLEKAQTLERALKAEGFGNTLCSIAEDFNKVKVKVHAEEELTEEQLAHIRAIAVSQTDIREVEISRN